MGLLSGVMVPLVTPMSAPGVPTEADALLEALAASGVRSLMLFGSNGEGPLLPVSALGGFAVWAAGRWRALTGGPVLCNVTAAGTAEVRERAAAVAPARPDALVLSPPIYFRHRDDEILAHYAALSDLDTPVVAYNAPRYSNPLTPALIDELVTMPHVVGMKDSSGDLELVRHLVSVRRPGFEVSQGSETQLVAALRLGVDGIVPGIANLAPALAVALVAAHEDGRAGDADLAQQTVDRLLTLHSVRPGVPAVKAVLADRGLCPPHVAAPLVPCTEAERGALISLLLDDESHLLPRRQPMAEIGRRTFGLGVAAASVAVTLGTAGATASATPRRHRPVQFDDTTLWDNTVDPLESYHVHGLAVLPNDTILVATEGRHEVCDAGPRDLLVRRSTDGGDTWEATQTLVASVDGQSWGNPAFVVDRVTGGIFLFYMLSIRLPENTGCSGDIGDLYMISSADGGRTWGAPQPMSGLFDHFPYDWALHGPGPGHGIQLDNGRLLLNCSHRRVIIGNTVEQRFYGVASIYSDDHGATWQTTAEVPVSVDYPINEARVVQRADGTVLVNGRAASGGNRQRIVAVSADRGLTWSPPRLDGSTGTFNAVDASLLRYTGGPRSSEVDRILFSRPDSPVRTNMTVSVSYDEAHSFRYHKVINEGRSYYSELAKLSDGTILLVYGCDGDNPSFPRRVAICRFSLDWLTDGRDSLGRGPRIDEQLVDLAARATAVGGAVSVVADPVARKGSRVVLTPEQPGAHLEYTVDVRRAGSYELMLRYFRAAAGGLVTVTVDGREPRTAVLDTTADRADGYDVAQLDTVSLRAGRHKIRFTAAGAGRGAGSLVSLDALSLVRAQSRPDVRNEIVVDNDELGYETVRGAAWAAGTGVAGYRGGNYRSVPAGTGERAVRWRLVVPRNGVYEVQASHTTHENRASNAPFTITHQAGTSVVRVDQRVAGTTEPRGGSWIPLGTYRLAEGLTTIELSDDADGVVIADAVRLLRRE